jgi:hypothetical protein
MKAIATYPYVPATVFLSNPYQQSQELFPPLELINNISSVHIKSKAIPVTGCGRL